MIDESKIRDSLSRKLNLIEYGLVLEGIESPIKNKKGTSGRLDIYARDQFQHRVIIEIKRSNKAAREAIHELYKYISLLRETHGIPEDEIRCIVISTEWEELLVPFSTFVLDSEYEVSGYKAIVSDEGEVLHLKPITPLSIDDAVAWYENHDIFFFKNENKRNIFVSKFKKISKDFSGINFICVPMNYDISKEDPIKIGSLKSSINPVICEIIFPFNIYIIRTKIRPKYIDDIKSIVGEDIIRKIEYEPLDEAIGIYIHKKLRNSFDDWELGYNTKFSNLLNTWKPKDSIRIGEKISSKLFYSEDDVQEIIMGLKGKHQSTYMEIVSPRFKNKWINNQKKLSSFLEMNPQWKRIIFEFINKFEHDINILVKLHIYNPCNIIKTIYDSNFHFENPYIPYFYISIEDFNGSPKYFLLGHLAWTEKKSDLDLQKFFEYLSKGEKYFSGLKTPEIHSTARIFIALDKMSELEMGLCKFHNLTYVATEFNIKNSSLEQTHFWSIEKDKVRRLTCSNNIYSNLTDFCNEYENYVDEICLLLDGYSQFKWEELDFYCVEYFQSVEIALQNQRFINLSNVQPPQTQYGIGIIERSDLVLKNIFSDDLMPEDVEFRNQIIKVFTLLFKLEPEVVESYVQSTVEVFGYTGLFNTVDQGILEMWQEIHEIIESQSSEDLIWLKSLAAFLCSDVESCQKIKDGLIYKEQGLERLEVFQRLNLDYSQTNSLDPGIRNIFELGIL
jgi:hypothetical protein